MRIVCDVKIPNFDSAGRTGRSNHVYPCQENSTDIKNILIEFFKPMKQFKSGMEINIKFEDDWNNESNI